MKKSQRKALRKSQRSERSETPRKKSEGKKVMKSETRPDGWPISATTIIDRCEKTLKEAVEIDARNARIGDKAPGRNGQAHISRRMYRLADRCASARNGMKNLRRVVPCKYHPRGKLAEIPAAWTLTLIFSKQGPITKATRNKIRLHAYALEYAARKNVPTRHLVGFIYEQGGLAGIEKLFIAETKS